MGFNDFLGKLFGTKADRDMKAVKPYLQQIKAVYPKVEALSDDELRERSAAIKAEVRAVAAEAQTKIDEIKAKIEQTDFQDRAPLYAEIDNLDKKALDTMDEILDRVLPEVFAIIRETARRFKENETITVTATDFDRHLATKFDFVTIEGDKAIYKNEWMAGGNMIKWDMAHYDVQFIGGVVLHKGKIAEMATGEGKTLVATLPVFLNALTGNGVHVVTVNDYLSKRDSEWMGPLYMFHGLSVDCIDKHKPNSDERRQAYNADITFGTNNEFCFDLHRRTIWYNAVTITLLWMRWTQCLLTTPVHLLSSQVLCLRETTRCLRSTALRWRKL